MLKIANELKDLPRIALSKVNDLQGDFKELSEKNAAKLIANIEKYGYKYPLYIWFDKQGNAYNLDGNQRQNVLSKLYGPDLELPYIAVSAKNKTEAKKQILALNSDFGKVTQSGFEMLISDFSEMDLGEVGELFTFEMPTFEGMGDIDTKDEFTLPSGDKAPFQQMTFTLADEQAEVIKNAITEIKQTEEYKFAETMGNENSNGNALYLIVSTWAGQRI